MHRGWQAVLEATKTQTATQFALTVAAPACPPAELQLELADDPEMSTPLPSAVNHALLDSISSVGTARLESVPPTDQASFDSDARERSEESMDTSARSIPHVVTVEQPLDTDFGGRKRSFHGKL